VARIGAFHAIGAYRIYLILSGLTQLANATIFTVLAVYYVTVVHLDPLQLVLIGTALEGTIFLFEIPTGVVADTFSRRLSVILGMFLVGAAYLAEGAVPLFGAILLAEAVRGVGETCLSGAREAWVAGEVGEERIAHVFLRAAQVRQVAAFVGVALSVGLASVALRLPLLVSGALTLATGTFLALAMPERHFRPTPRGERATWRAMGATLRGGLGLVRASPLLLMFVALAVVLGATSEGFDRLWEAHFLTDLTLPPLGRLRPIVWFGVIQLILMPLQLVGLEAVRRLVDPRRQRRVARALLALTALQIIGVVAFGLAGSFPLALAAFCGASLCRDLASPIYDAWLTRSSNPRVRATVLSFMSQSNALGQVAGGPGIGALGKWVSLRAAIVCSGLLLSPALALYGRALRRPHISSKWPPDAMVGDVAVEIEGVRGEVLP